MPDSPRPPLDAVVVRLRAAGCVFAEDEAALLVEAAEDAGQLEAMVAERVEGRPLEQVLGWAEFAGLRIVVEPGVFVPRRRTELMARETVALAGAVAGRRTPVVVDLCCGSGAVGAVVADALPEAEVWAADIDPAAVRCARRNVRPPERVLQGDLFAPLPRALRGRVDVLAVNTPYVPTGAIATMPPEARLHEPAVALDGGPDGLAVARRVAAEAPGWLAPGGSLLIETSQRQAPVLAATYLGHGLLPRVVGSDDLGATLVAGTLPGA